MSASENEYPGLEARVRMLVERDLGPMARAWKKELPGDLGFIAFLFHWGEGGGIAYVSNGQREDTVKSLAEWMRHEGERSFPHLKDFFDYLYLATRQPGDQGYDKVFAERVRREGMRGMRYG